MLQPSAAAALSAAGVSLIHDGETALMVLLWHVGAIALLVLLGAVFGRWLFAWIGPGRGQVKRVFVRHSRQGEG